MLDQGVLSVEDIEHFKSVMDKKASLVSRSLSFLSNSESRRFAEKRRAAKVKKRRSYDLIVDNLIKSVEGKGKESKRAIYAFGDGDFASSKKGISGTAFHLQILRRLMKRRVVVSIDEYRTTCACPKECEGDMTRAFGNEFCQWSDGSIHRKKVHGTSICKFCHIQWGRDKAAAINMAKILCSLLFKKCRPKYLCRSCCNGAAPKKHKLPT